MGHSGYSVTDPLQDNKGLNSGKSGEGRGEDKFEGGRFFVESG